MKSFFARVRESYEYVMVDLSPIGPEHSVETRLLGDDIDKSPGPVRDQEAAERRSIYPTFLPAGGRQVASDSHQ